MLRRYEPARNDAVAPYWARFVVLRKCDGTRLGYTSDAQRAEQMADALGVPCDVAEVSR